MKLQTLLYSLPLIFLATLSHAGTYQENLEQCLKTSVSEQDKLQLTKGIFFTISANPDFTKYTNIPSNDLINSDKEMSKIYERILSESCSKEIGDVIKNEGTNALQSAFEFLGRTSMEGLVSNKTVQNRMMESMKYINLEKISKAMNND